MSLSEELVSITNVLRAISMAENENEIMRALGLRSSEELFIFWEFLLSQISSNKEVYLFALGLSEKELIGKLEEFGWTELQWKDSWETMDSCACCWTEHSAGFYGNLSFYEKKKFSLVSAKVIFKVLLELKKEKKIYSY